MVVRSSAIFFAASLLWTTTATAQVGSVPDPTVEGPVQGGVHGHPLMDNWFDPTPYGYVEEEFFISRLAREYPGDGTRDGAYKTRLMVFRPADPADWNGSVALEWENVTGQTPAPVTWLETHSFYMREGYAFVAVSAQSAGIC